jgi:hypothetical protein
MIRPRKLFLVGSTSLIFAALLLILATPSMLRSFFYPKPASLPPVVSQSMEQLITRLEGVLESNAPVVAKSLQPGLTDQQISTLETQGGFHLTADLKSLYRWRNGMPTNSTVGLLPGQRFLPLDEFVNEQTAMRQQLKSATLGQKAAHAVFTGHRNRWVHVLDDGAGDGYFYDPDRAEAEGAFFYHMAEAKYYVWFPSPRNFLFGVTECYETGAVKVSTNSLGLGEDSEQTQRIWNRVAKSSEND